MLFSTLDMAPSPSTWNPRPSTLDPRQKDRLAHFYSAISAGYWWVFLVAKTVLLVMLETCVFHLRSFCTYTPSSLNSETLSSSVGPILIGAGIGQDFLKVIHISLVFLAFSSILFCTAHLSKWVTASCIWLTESLKTSSYRVQSSAYLQVDTGISLGMQSSISLTCTLKSVGEMTPPWGTPAVTSPCLERTPGSLTCCVLPDRYDVHASKFSQQNNPDPPDRRLFGSLQRLHARHYIDYQNL